MSVCPSCHVSYDATVAICPADGTPLAIESAADANLGQVLEGKYRIDTFISAGGMGSVYRATHVMLDKIVAIKLIRSQLVQTAEAALRFQREARAASALSHPNIAAVFDFGQTAGGTLYIVMEYVEGPSLKEIIRQDGPMEPAKIVAILGPVASALAQAHRQHIIHRDLKPHNIMLAAEPDRPITPKLLDFGIAKTADEPAGGLTVTGYALGTPQYMSPEQAMGKAVDGRSDLYSLGVVLYEMLIGEVPFSDTSVAGVLLKQMTAAPDAPSRRRPDVSISPRLEAIALRCLDKEPDHRFQSADEFIAALSECGTDDRPAAVVSIGTPPGVTAADADTVAALAAADVVTPAVVPTPSIDSAEPARSIEAPSGQVSSGNLVGRTGDGPTAPHPTTTRPIALDEPPARVVKPGTQPTVIVAAPSPNVAAQSAAPGPAFWIAAAIIVLAVIGSGAWVIRSWAPPSTAVHEPAPAPNATPAMAQPAPPASSTPETPAAGAAPLTRNQDMAAAPAPDPTAPPPDIARSPVAGPVDTPPVSPNASQPAGSTPVSTPTTSRSREGSAPAGRSSTTPSAGVDRRPPARSGDGPPQVVPDARAATAAEPAATAAAPIAPARARHPRVFVDCAGPPEICSPIRSAMADALRKQQMPLVTGRSGADVTLAVDVEIVEQRVQQSFGTTFAPRIYSVDVSGESDGLAVAMPPARTFSFDAQVGRERANENARVIASDAVDKVREFWNEQANP